MAFYHQWRFDDFHTELPEGCDEFGYLQLAKTFSNNTLKPAADFRVDLVRHLESEGFQYNDYAWLIAPHAHHWHAETEKVINQYPPFTSWYLSLFPKAYRQLFFPLIALLPSFFVFAFLGWVLFRKIHEQFLILMALLVFAFWPATQIELTRINSIAPTFGLLVAAGVCFKNHRWLATSFAFLALLFRPANAPFIGMFWLLSFLFEGSFTFQSVKTFAAQTVTLLLSLLPVFIYQNHLLGHFFSSTYSKIDTAFSGFSALPEHLTFYFLKEPIWTFSGVFLLIIFTLLSFKNDRKTWKVAVLSFSVYLTFYLFHDVTIYYYPYAPALFFGGLIIHKISELIGNRKFHSQWQIGFLLVALFFFFRYEPIAQPENQTEQYLACFTQGVVWSELRSGTVEYTTEFFGFRYYWGNEKARKSVIKWLAKHQINQVFWVSDLNDSEDKITTELATLGLDYSISQCPLGSLISVSHD